MPVPLPPNLDDFVTNRQAAIELGKSLFWDMQVGGDGATACASCHFHAGGDNRTMNTLAPRTSEFRGANVQLKKSDFPFHKLANPNLSHEDENEVLFDTSEVVGSQGVPKTQFAGINGAHQRDWGQAIFDTTFSIDGIDRRQVTGRNTPTMINAIFMDRLFWDGRANRFFNGVNPFGDMDPDAKIWVASADGTLGRERILLDNGSAASQAVGPPNNEVEMSFNGRTFSELGQKMLARRPLSLQSISKTDSVLGYLSAGRQKGFADSRINYASMVKKAFPAKYWNSTATTPDGFTLMEANFSLFWGLSIMMYESTLVSDDSPFDRFANGDESALTAQQKQGLAIFKSEGKCTACHRGPEFTGAAVSSLRGRLSEREGVIEFMAMQDGNAFYDSGFYNIGVRPTEQDVGVGGSHPDFGPLSITRRQQNGTLHRRNGNNASVGPNDRVAVDGAFKTPSLRNIELTGPYMHNGGMSTLEQVVQFYTRGADFFHHNIENLDPDVEGIPELQLDVTQQAALVAFLKSLTDDRVRRQAAPFDHPAITVFNGSLGSSEGESIDNDVFIPAVGREGGKPIVPFINVLK